MNMARLLKQQSSCISVKVGCVIVKQDRVISIGYNGTPSGYVNCNQYWGDDYLTNVFDKREYLQHRKNHHQWSDIHQIHAQMNALMFAAKTGISTNNTTMFVTTFPCQYCLKNIIQAGITQIIYQSQYDLGLTQQNFMQFIKSKINIIKYSQE